MNAEWISFVDWRGTDFILNIEQVVLKHMFWKSGRQKIIGLWEDDIVSKSRVSSDVYVD